MVDEGEPQPLSALWVLIRDVPVLDSQVRDTRIIFVSFVSVELSQI